MNVLQTEDTCCLCGKKARKTSTVNLEFDGINIPVVAALCKKCYRLPNRGQLLRRYVDSIFGAGEKSTHRTQHFVASNR